MLFTKYSRKKYSAIASLRILVYIEFRAKVYGERGKYTVRSLQANMDGDEGELERFEKFKFYFRFVKQELR